MAQIGDPWVSFTAVGGLVPPVFNQAMELFMPGGRKNEYKMKGIALEQLNALVRWIEDAAFAHKMNGPLPSYEAVLNGCRVINPVNGNGEYKGLVGLKISESVGYRYYEPELVAVVTLLTIYGGSIIWNRASKDRWYAQLSFTVSENIEGKNGSDHVSLDRLTMDAQAGEWVREGNDHRNRSVLALRTEPRKGPKNGREWAIANALKAHESSEGEQKARFTPDQYERIIRELFALIDSKRQNVAIAA